LRRRNAGDGADDLRRDVSGGRRRGQFPPQRESKADGRIEMRAKSCPKIRISTTSIAPVGRSQSFVELQAL
jgi:hypothetical protein